MKKKPEKFSKISLKHENNLIVSSRHNIVMMVNYARRLFFHHENKVFKMHKVIAKFNKKKKIGKILENFALTGLIVSSCHNVVTMVNDGGTSPISRLVASLCLSSSTRGKLTQRLPISCFKIFLTCLNKKFVFAYQVAIFKFLIKFIFKKKIFINCFWMLIKLYTLIDLRFQQVYRHAN